MKRICSVVIIALLSITGYSMLPMPEAEVNGKDFFAPSFSRYWKMDMDVSDVSLASFLGETTYNYAGWSISGAGDLNGDGFDDILVSAPENAGGGRKAGKIYIIFGKLTGWQRNITLLNADASFQGIGEFEFAGKSVSVIGDVNKDGYDDILIGVPENDQGGTNAGQTYLIMGKASGWNMNTSLSQANASFIGEVPGDESGISVSGAGDVNGDGYDDILIGASLNGERGTGAGQSYLILGKASGWSMNTSLSQADASFIGEVSGDGSGISVSGAGDVNGDGYDDILIGAHLNDESGTEAGQTYLILGKASGWSMDTNLSKADASFLGVNSEENSGYSVSSAGDVNGDGYDDILIGAYKYNAGQSYLILGKSSGWSVDMILYQADASFIGENPNDESGISVSGAGDLNDDGYDDFLIGASRNIEGGYQSGQTYLFFGKASGWSVNDSLSNANASFLGDDGRLGNSVSRAGDVNNDGYDDILLGASYYSGGVFRRGKAYLIFGSCTHFKFEADHTPATASTGEELVFSVKMGGDSKSTSVFVEYWFGDGERYNVTMTGMGGLTWNHAIRIPIDSLDELHYKFSAPGGVWINTSIKNITIIDDIIPKFGKEMSDTIASTGDPFKFSIGVTENVQLKFVHIEYWFGEGYHLKITPDLKPGDQWEATIMIPEDSLETLHYRYIAEDISGNSNITMIKDIEITDNDRPILSGDDKLLIATTGDRLVFEVVANDNIGIYGVDREFGYSEGDG
ncbi:MAG: integrin alpha, partial [Thermoplasmatota archaeon]